MLGPDCWNYSAKELGAKAVQAGATDALGMAKGVEAATLRQPLAQALRYSVSGVGVHLLWIGLGVLLLAVTTPRASPLHVQVPLALLLLDVLTLANARRPARQLSGSRRRRGYGEGGLRTGRGDAVAAAWIVRRQAAATPRRRR